VNQDRVNLTIIGIGGERTIQFNGANNECLFFVGVMHPAGVQYGDLTLGENITLKGIQTSETALINVGTAGTLTMKAGSKITGHKTASKYGAVFASGTFTMDGGEISGNEATVMDHGTAGVFVGTQEPYGAGNFIMNGGLITGNTSLFITGGVFVEADEYAGNAAFTMNGGTITGNLSRGFDGPPSRADVWLEPNAKFTNNDGTIGSLEPENN